jgi:hypothetical protein
VRAAPVRLQYGLQGPRQGGQVAVVHPPVVQLAGELAEQPRPGAAGGHKRHLHFDAPLDELHRGQTGGSRPGLLPRPVPAGSRAPLRDRPPASRRDGSTAPPAECRSVPPFATVHVRCSRARASLRGRPLGLLTPLLLSLPLLRSISGAAAVSMPSRLRTSLQKPVTTNRQTSRCMRCAPLDLAVSPMAWRWWEPPQRRSRRLAKDAF